MVTSHRWNQWGIPVRRPGDTLRGRSEGCQNKTGSDEKTQRLDATKKRNLSKKASIFTESLQVASGNMSKWEIMFLEHSSDIHLKEEKKHFQGSNLLVLFVILVLMI